MDEETEKKEGDREEENVRLAGKLSFSPGRNKFPVNLLATRRTSLHYSAGRFVMLNPMNNAPPRPEIPRRHILSVNLTVRSSFQIVPADVSRELNSISPHYPLSLFGYHRPFPPLPPPPPPWTEKRVCFRVGNR